MPNNYVRMAWENESNYGRPTFQPVGTLWSPQQMYLCYCYLVVYTFSVVLFEISGSIQGFWHTHSKRISYISVHTTRIRVERRAGGFSLYPAASRSNRLRLHVTGDQRTQSTNIKSTARLQNITLWKWTRLDILHKLTSCNIIKVDYMIS